MCVFSYLVQDTATRVVSEKIDEILLEVHDEWHLRWRGIRTVMKFASQLLV